MIRWLVTGSQLPGYWRFKKALGRTEDTQRAVLNRVLSTLGTSKAALRYGLRPGMSYEDFARALPVTDYAFWEKDILRQKEHGGNEICPQTERYQPTSGSTSAQKWIPYSKAFMREMDAAIQPWMGDVGLTRGRVFSGSQYWSLSWLPQDQRDKRPSNDDLELLPPWKRAVLEKVMAVPAAVTYTKTMDESQFATLAYLCSRSDLSLVSVWSPTFWLTLLDKLDGWREELAWTLESGKWALKGAFQDTTLAAPASRKAARFLRESSGTELSERLWPRLSLISCWDSAGAKPWAEQVRQRHPGIELQPKGLWATEGVITIPFQGQYPAAITSHFLEWEDLDDGKIYPTWRLRTGQSVQPLLSGAHGLLRYKLNDALTVTGRLHDTPVFDFKGRLRETDLVGEKLSAQLTEEAFGAVEAETGLRPFTLFAVRTRRSKPYYLVLAREGNIPAGQLERSVDSALSKVFHYKLARELGQLGPVRARLAHEPEKLYQSLQQAKGMLAGDIKCESLSEISEELLP